MIGGMDTPDLSQDHELHTEIVSILDDSLFLGLFATETAEAMARRICKVVSLHAGPELAAARRHIEYLVSARDALAAELNRLETQLHTAPEPGTAPSLCGATTYVMLDMDLVQCVCHLAPGHEGKHDDHGTAWKMVDEFLPGCPVDVWDGPYIMRCGLGGSHNVCAYHGPFIPARRCLATPRCRSIAGHRGRCNPPAGT